MPQGTTIPFDPRTGYPAGPDLAYECLQCGDSLPSQPQENHGCRCGNIFVDVDAGRISVRDDHLVRLFRV